MGPSKARPALPQVLTCLARPDNPRPLRENLLTLIKELLQPEDQNALPVLRIAVEDNDVLIRRQAALALLKLGDTGITTALPALREMLRDDDPADRRVAVVALRKLGSGRGAPSILTPAMPELLKVSATDEEEEIRQQAQSLVDSLARNSKKGLMSLVEILGDAKQKEELRLQAATALDRQTRMRLGEARQRLQAIAADNDTPQRVRNAVRTLVKKLNN
jgi:HEAT repeat protein